MNLNPIHFYLVQGKELMMVAKGSANVTITGCNDKRKITTTFVITVSRKFLPIQLIYSGKTEPSRIPIS